MDYIYILVSVDVDSYHGRNWDVGYYRTEEAALAAIPRGYLQYEREPFNYPPNKARLTIQDFGYYLIDKAPVLG